MNEKNLSLLSIIFLMFLNNVLIPPLGSGFVTPCMPIVGIIFWLLMNKNILNNYFIFSLGLLNDFLMGTPIGSSSIFYFIVKLFINFLNRRLIKKSFVFEIVKNTLGITVYFFSIYIFIIIYYENYLSLSHFFMSYLLTLSILPIIYIFLIFIKNKKKFNEA